MSVQDNCKMIDAPDSLVTRIYFAAKDGMAISLFSLLIDHFDYNVARRVINRLFVEDDGQRCTPLIAAARQGHYKVVKFLLYFNPELEVEGTVNFDGYVIEGASALWCAAGKGYLNIVKTLVKAGADVNHATKMNSTPLRAACFDGRLDIVKYLTEHYANVHIANKYNNTCLMISAYKGYCDVVTYLLLNSADPNERALCGATALFFASECGHVSVVEALLTHGARPSASNDAGMTPLKAAAERARATVVEMLLQIPDVSREDRIEALELLGASFANDKDQYCLRKAYKYLRIGMELRYDGDVLAYEKPYVEPIAAYENWRESRNLVELSALEHSPNSLHMEALAVRERVLGACACAELAHHVIFRGAVYADNARFDRCVALWVHAVHLRQQVVNGAADKTTIGGGGVAAAASSQQLMRHESVAKDLLRLAQVLSQMVHVGVQVSYDQIVAVLEAAVLELQRLKDKLTCSNCVVDTRESIGVELERNTITSLYIITVLAKLMSKYPCDADVDYAISKLIFQVNKMSLTFGKERQTLLHLACNAETPVDDFHINDTCKFPCADTASLLIRCGADVNAMDTGRNTPLHVIVNYHKSISDFVTLHTIILRLTEAGAHLDCVNSRGETPLDSSATGIAEIILKTQSKLSLQCIAAMAVKAHKLPYKGHVPATLEQFIELHGVPDYDMYYADTVDTVK